VELEYAYGQTPIDEDEKEGLLIKTITTHGELNELEQLNIEEAELWRHTNPVSTEKVLTEDFVRKLHLKMFANVWSWAGTFRRSNKNIGVEWTDIPTNLRYLLDNVKYWVENNVYGGDEIAIRFKYEIVKIHCFPNGNGRHSRIIADTLIESIGGSSFSWNGSNMARPDETRRRYLDAIKKVDKTNDIDPLIEFARG